MKSKNLIFILACLFGIDTWTFGANRTSRAGYKVAPTDGSDDEDLEQLQVDPERLKEKISSAYRDWMHHVTGIDREEIKAPTFNHHVSAVDLRAALEVLQHGFHAARKRNPALLRQTVPLNPNVRVLNELLATREKRQKNLKPIMQDPAPLRDVEGDFLQAYESSGMKAINIASVVIVVAATFALIDLQVCWPNTCPDGTRQFEAGLCSNGASAHLDRNNNFYCKNDAALVKVFHGCDPVNATVRADSQCLQDHLVGEMIAVSIAALPHAGLLLYLYTTKGAQALVNVAQRISYLIQYRFWQQENMRLQGIFEKDLNELQKLPLPDLRPLLGNIED